MSTKAGELQGPITPLFDDLHDPLLRPFLDESEIIVTSGHLGESAEDQEQVADMLQLRKVSAVLQPQWAYGADRDKPEWTRRFEILQNLLGAAGDAEAEVQPLTLNPVTSITATIRGVTRDLSARLRGQELVVAYEPLDFADEATAIVLEYYGLDDDTKRTTFATVLVGALDQKVRFTNAATKFAHAFAPQLVDLESFGTPGIVAAPAVSIEAAEPVFTLPVNSEDTNAELAKDFGEQHRIRITQRAEDILASVVSRPADGPGFDTAPTPVTRGISGARLVTPEQQRRGSIGEAEFLRRVSLPGGWGGMSLIADRTRDGCGYDFLCSSVSGELKVEVKTFAANGHVVITPLEWNEARASRGRYRIVGFLAVGDMPERWNTYVLDDPFPILEAKGEWQLAANLDVSPNAIFQLPQ